MKHKCDGCRYKGEHQEMGFAPFGVCFKETNLMQAQQNYDAECCPYIVDVYTKGTSEEVKEVLEDLKGKSEAEDFEKAVEAIQALSKAITEALTPFLDAAMQTIKKIYGAVLHYYPNKRVVHLAVHHPKEKVRKKNQHRIMRWIEKG